MEHKSPDKAQRIKNAQRLQELENSPELLQAIYDSKSFDIYLNQLASKLHAHNKLDVAADLLFQTLNQLKGLDMTIQEMIDGYKANDKDLGWKIYWGHKRSVYDWVNDFNNTETEEFDIKRDETTPAPTGGDIDIQDIDEALGLVDDVLVGRFSKVRRNKIKQMLEHGIDNSNRKVDLNFINNLAKNQKEYSPFKQTKKFNEAQGLNHKLELINEIIGLIEDEDSDLRRVSAIMKQSPDYFEELIYQSRAKYVITLFNNFAGADARGTVGLLDQYKLINTLYIERERLVKLINVYGDVQPIKRSPLEQGLIKFINGGVRFVRVSELTDYLGTLDYEERKQFVKEYQDTDEEYLRGFKMLVITAHFKKQYK